MHKELLLFEFWFGSSCDERDEGTLLSRTQLLPPEANEL